MYLIYAFANECLRHVSRKSRCIKIRMRPLNHNYIIFDQEIKITIPRCFLESSLDEGLVALGFCTIVVATEVAGVRLAEATRWTKNYQTVQ